MAVTLLDVAREAGVSRTTASNAFNDPTQLSSALREQVLSIAKKLGYAGPSPTARAMRNGRTMMVGIVFEESLPFVLEDPYARALLSGLSDRLTSADYSLALLPVDKTHSGIERVQVDGIVAYRVRPNHDALRIAQQRGWRIVHTGDTQNAGPEALSVTINESGGAELALQHLAELGHRRVFALIDMDEDLPPQGGPPEFPFFEQAERWRGYRAVADVHEMELIPIAPGRNLRRNGFEATRWLLNNERVTAIVAMTDTHALGALEAINLAGLRAGRDVSVVGFDDIPEASGAGLTTISQPIWERGYEAARLLIEEPSQRSVELSCTLITRTSTGPVPHRAN